MKGLILTFDASGAAMAGKMGLVVVIVDVIDFSTSMEAAIDAGAAAIYGAGTDTALPPVAINPHHIGYLAGIKAISIRTEVVVVAEPRVGEERLRASSAASVIKGIRTAGAEIAAVLPSMGAETAKLTDMKGRVVVGSTGSGGVAFDAAVTAGAVSVLTGTIARTLNKDGSCSARDAAGRAAKESLRTDKGIAVVAASGNSPEDLLAAEYIYKILISLIR